LVTYLAKRLAEALLTLALIATLTFFLLRFLPGGPFDESAALAPDVKLSLETKYGLDQPIYTQFGKYAGHLLKGDLGDSLTFVGQPVSSILLEALPVSLLLGGLALVFALAVGLLLGLLSARHQGSWIDRGTMLLSVTGLSLPSFMIGPLLILMFKGNLPPALWEGPTSAILPTLTLGLRPAGLIARLVRSSVLDVLRSDFVRTARAKGVTETIVFFKHVARNALVPLLSISGPLVAGILSGSFVVESIFAIPGLAKYFVSGVTNRDYPLVMGLTLVYAVLLVFSNLLSDLALVATDPRIEIETVRQ
jgi:oligopeptide transport system permease protein